MGLTIFLIYLKLVCISFSHPIIIDIITILSLTRLRICGINFLLTLRDRLSWVNMVSTWDLLILQSWEPIVNEIFVYLGVLLYLFFPHRVLNLFLRFLVFNLFSGIREGVALSINGYIIIICFHTFVIFLNYFLFKCIVSLLTKYFYCRSFYTWASGSDNRGNPYPTYWSKWIDWLIDWLT